MFIINSNTGVCQPETDYIITQSRQLPGTATLTRLLLCMRIYSASHSFEWGKCVLHMRNGTKGSPAKTMQRNVEKTWMWFSFFCNAAWHHWARHCVGQSCACISLFVNAVFLLHQMYAVAKVCSSVSTTNYFVGQFPLIELPGTYFIVSLVHEMRHTYPLCCCNIPGKCECFLTGAPIARNARWCFDTTYTKLLS